MKKTLLLASALLLMASVANATAYVGLWADENHSICSVATPQYTNFDMWVFMIDAERGIHACEYKIEPPAGLITIATLNNPDINLTMQDWTIGITISFASCWETWVWSQKITFMSLIGPVPGTINISGRPDSLPYYLQTASCELGYPIYPLEIETILYLNCECPWTPVAVEESSWGAIKSLF